MKQYRLRLFHKNETKWLPWRNITTPITEEDVLTIQFNEPLTLEETKEFFKSYQV